MIRLTRRKLAAYAADALVGGVDEQQVVNQLAGYLVANKRAKEVPQLVKDIEKALEKNGLVTARVASARALDATEYAAIEQLLKDRYDAKTVSLETLTNADLLGGVVVTTASDEFDGSLRRSINRLKGLKV